MSEPKTEEYEKLKRFMALTPEQRDEYLWFQDARFKSVLESEGLLEITEFVRGSKDQPSANIRVKWLEEKVGGLIKSNSKLQAAIYVATGAWIAVKFYFEYIAPHHP